ncbi:MAG: hypothetical protein KIT87_29405 [Anaerolineae bacterium]|nr:hypothetical protein [Anaerolineae bacterium]
MRGHGFVNGTGIGGGFGREAGDRVWNTLSIPDDMEEGLLLARYRASEGGVAFDLRGLATEQAHFAPCTDFRLSPIPLGSIPAGEYRLEFVSRGGGLLELDGFVLLKRELQDQVR